MEASLARSGTISTRTLGAVFLWLLIFSGGFVFREPAPYELFAVVLVPTWFLAGLPLPRQIAPLFVFLLLYLIGGIIGLSQVKTYDQAPMFIAVTGFLALTSIFFACLVAEDHRRLKHIGNAYIASACFSVALGLAGYFQLVPGAFELFTLYGRASGGFEDPNVFGPFLILPLGLLFYGVMNREPGSMMLRLVLMLFILLGIFMSFSRASWGLAVFTLGGIFVLSLINAKRPTDRVRMFAWLAIAIVGAVGLVLIALSSDQVSALFAERAQIVQNYDGGRFGRFARHALGFKLVADRPLGLGALEFGRRYYPGDPHNIWLKSFTAYGWLGGISYPILVFWTIIRAVPLLFKPRPWQPVLIVSFVVFFGHQVIGAVIDIDHWRHYFLLLGLIWGMIAAEARWSDEMQRQTI
uniref:O-antigen ligase family protein n=1 Tax=Pararhizobium sp. IMCC3301 TaxID=3067904 RepID=UPI0027428E1E|nr:O-antigen ligase family protein [Pararhizobium sp. IMCC3301]